MEYINITLLVLFSGLFSGLTISLSSLSKDELEMKAAQKDIQSIKVLSILEDYNLLLVTLLLGNTVVNVLLTNYIGQTAGTGLLTVVLSTFLILIFGEITPSAVLTKHALKMGSLSVPLVKMLLYLFYPLSKPIAYILTKALGQDLPKLYTKTDFEYILNKHQNSKNSSIDEQDSRIMKGVLLLGERIVAKEITKKEEVFTLNYTQIIDLKLLNIIKETGYTRIPIIKDKSVIGIINTKHLIGLDLSKENKAIDIMKSDKYLIFDDVTKLDEVLEEMINAKIHFSIINYKGKWIGILTMEDILEVMLQQKIYDETDNIKKL